MGTGIRPLEVIPAIEILYIQFRSLTDRMAHSNVIVVSFITHKGCKFGMGRRTLLNHCSFFMIFFQILMLLSKIPSNTPPPPGGGFGYLPQGISLVSVIPNCIIQSPTRIAVVNIQLSSKLPEKSILKNELPWDGDNCLYLL